MTEKKEEVKKLKVRNSRKLYIPIYLMIIILFLTISYIKTSGKEVDDLAFKTVLIFSIGLLIFTEIHRLINSYEINAHSLVASKGILNRTIKKVDLLSISDVDSKQNIWQRILNFGNVEARLFSKDSTTSIKNINDPIKFADFLEKMMGERRDGSKGGMAG